MRVLVAYASGIVFAVGLVVGGMTQPEKIVDFLDVAGNWDPSLALVMGGALLVNVFAYRWTRNRDAPFLEEVFHIPSRTDIDWRLVTGSAIFGIGWGVSGYCPGPALTSVVSGQIPVLATIGGIVAGVFLYRAFDRWWTSRGSPSGDDG